MDNYNFERFVNQRELSDTITYVVKTGDTLYKISEMYGVSVDNLIAINKLASSMIYPNQILFIPRKNSNSNTYTTVTNDTLDIISKKSGLSIDKIKDYNNIYNLVLSPGQLINLSESKKYIIVNQGMSFSDVLNMYDLTAEKLLELNKESWLMPGTKIIIR